MSFLDKFFGSFKKDQVQEEPDQNSLPDFEFVEQKVNSEHVKVATRIKSGKYKGLIFSVGQVRFVPQETPEGEIQVEPEKIDFNYNFLIEFAPVGLEVGPDLDRIVGDIILESLKKDLVGNHQ